MRGRGRNQTPDFEILEWVLFTIFWNKIINAWYSGSEYFLVSLHTLENNSQNCPSRKAKIPQTDKSRKLRAQTIDYFHSPKFMSAGSFFRGSFCAGKFLNLRYQLFRMFSNVSPQPLTHQYHPAYQNIHPLAPILHSHISTAVNAVLLASSNTQRNTRIRTHTRARACV